MIDDQKMTTIGLFTNGNMIKSILAIIALVSVTHSVSVHTSRRAIAVEQEHVNESMLKVCDRQERIAATQQNFNTRIALTEKSIETMNQSIKEGFRELKQSIKDISVR